MIASIRKTALALACLGGALQAQTAQTADPVIRAMKDELARSLSLQIPSLEKPYYIDYAVDQLRVYSAAATLGGLVASQESEVSLPRVQVRVGSYDFDNTNFRDANFGYSSRLPRDNDYNVIRRLLWLDTDRGYKAAVEAISRKRAALKSMTQNEILPDFEKLPAVQLNRPGKVTLVHLPEWTERIRRLSAVFNAFPDIKSSNVTFYSSNGDHRFVSSEGTAIRQPEGVSTVSIQAAAQAKDGMTVRDWASVASLDLSGLPAEAAIRAKAEEVARNTLALAASPMGETYSGPVLFEGMAGPQLFAEVLGRNLALARKPVGQSGSGPSSELEGRQGVRVLPEMFDVVDDPQQTEFKGQRLFGTYAVDEEGVVPERLQVIQKGVLKSFLLTREPKRGFAHTNGRARLPGNFGTSQAALSNLFVTSRETVPVTELKKRLLELCQQRGKPYGILIRKMDFPSSASLDEARRLLTGQTGSLHPVSAPLLVYRVYPDGREELVRGLRLRGFNAKSLRDILFAGNDQNVFPYLENGAPFALSSIGGSTAESCVIAPSILIDDVDLFKVEDDLPKLPVVPAPAS